MILIGTAESTKTSSMRGTSAAQIPSYRAANAMNALTGSRTRSEAKNARLRSPGSRFRNMFTARLLSVSSTHVLLAHGRGATGAMKLIPVHLPAYCRDGEPDEQLLL